VEPTNSRARYMSGVQEYPNEIVVSPNQIGRDCPESVQALRRRFAGAGGRGCVASTAGLDCSVVALFHTWLSEIRLLAPSHEHTEVNLAQVVAVRAHAQISAQHAARVPPAASHNPCFLLPFRDYLEYNSYIYECA
jgi:hypothetical protein